MGTHDLALLDRIVARAQALGVGDDGYEIHMLYGIRMEAQRHLAAQGRTVKTLVSYGAAWFPWYMRRLAERPANVWFVVKSMLPWSSGAPALETEPWHIRRAADPSPSFREHLC
jgi:proline dehydrogenase